MFARGISSFTRTWMNLGCQKRLQSTSAMTYHALCTHRDTSHNIEAADQIPHPRKVKAVKCPVGGGGGDVEAGTGTLLQTATNKQRIKQQYLSNNTIELIILSQK